MEVGHDKQRIFPDFEVSRSKVKITVTIMVNRFRTKPPRRLGLNLLRGHISGPIMVKVYQKNYFDVFQVMFESGSHEIKN